MNDEQLRAIIRDVRTTLGAAAPDWADENTHDPGVTIVQLFGWIAELQLLMNRPQRDLAARAVTRVTERLRYLQQGPSADVEPLARPQYHAGKMLTAEDLHLEQDYVRGRLRRHNRYLVGTGIVHGLEVTIGSDANGAAVTVEPGFAIDSSGDEIVLAERRRHSLTESGESAYVLVRALDRPAEPIALTDSLEVTAHGRLIEDAAIDVSAQSASALPIARIVHDGSGWRLDPGYRPARLPKTIA